MPIFQPPAPDAKELAVIERIKTLKDHVHNLVVTSPSQWQGVLRRTLMARAVRGSNSIEGYKVSIPDAIAAASREEPLETPAPTWREIVGYQTAMTCVLQVVKDPLFRVSTDWIRSLHFMMLGHDESRNPGRYRPGAIFVRDDEAKEIVYSGPDADIVPGLMDEMVESIRIATAEKVEPTIVAAMGHLNLVMIHPFSDGNGRMARCLQTLILGLHGTRAPVFSSIEEYLGSSRNTPLYYEVLADVGGGGWHPERDTRPWIRFCLKAHLHQAMTVLARSREHQKLAALLEGELRQRALPERLIFALLDAAFTHVVRNGTYRSIADVSQQIAGRDLGLAVDNGFLVPKGESRGRYYVASDQLKEWRKQTAETKSFPDPFEGSGVSDQLSRLMKKEDDATEAGTR